MAGNDLSGAALVTAPDDSLIQDARALLAAFVRQDAKRLQVRLRPETSLTLSRERPPETGTELRAPHVATLENCKSPGTKVEEGETIASLRVLDQRFDLSSPASGVVESIAIEAGQLVEFGTVIAWIDSEEPA